MDYDALYQKRIRQFAKKGIKPYSDWFDEFGNPKVKAKPTDPKILVRRRSSVHGIAPKRKR